MQSLIQYRRFRFAIRKQYGSDQEKESCSSQDIVSEAIAGQNTARSISSHRTRPVETSDGIYSTSTTHTQQLTQNGLGHALEGIQIRQRIDSEGRSGKVFVVDWEGEDDPLNPRNVSDDRVPIILLLVICTAMHTICSYLLLKYIMRYLRIFDANSLTIQWSVLSRIRATLIVASISFVVGAASSADAAILPEAASDFGVSDVVESMTIGLYLAGYAVGAVFAGPFSEVFGRNAVYISTMIIFMIFIMASALAPNIGAQLAFRLLAGAFGATPLTCAGGSISDLWPSLEKTYAFPLFAITGFGGPILGPVIGSYMINLGSWRWAEWIVLLISGLVLGLILLFQPETFPPLLLTWKAKHFRTWTGDDRFRAESEINQVTLGTRLKVALTRPVLLALEPIVIFMTLYLTVLYIVLFTFLDGYPYIFQKVYGTSQGLTNVVFSGMFVGVILAGFLVPWVYKITKEAFINNTFAAETRLWFAMLGAPSIPIALFWMGWTDYASISIWSPIMASVLLGFGLICIFMTAYMYIIDSYELYAASALTFVTFTRYLTAGGMTVVGVPFYNNLGPHWTLTILGCISVLMTPIPYLFYKFGHKIRSRSRFAVSWA